MSTISTSAGSSRRATANPESGQVDTTGTSQLVEQQRGDQESAEDEEDVDADESAAHPGDAAVSDENQRNGYRTKTVQRRNTAASLRPIPDRQSTDPANRGDPARRRCRTCRCGVLPARLSACC